MAAQNASTQMHIFNSHFPVNAGDQEATELEPLQDDEVAQFRTKVLNMGVLTAQGATSREKELALMALRLIESFRTSAAKVVKQASLIVNLSLQRDYLVQQAENERARWESERLGWERSNDQDLQRYYSVLEVDNADLRRKEQQLLKRLTCLENEMVKLKPVLLLEPFVSKSSLEHASAYLESLPYPAESGKKAVSAHNSKYSRKKKELEEMSAIVKKDEGGPNVIANESALIDNTDKMDAEKYAPVLDSTKSFWNPNLDQLGGQTLVFRALPQNETDDRSLSIPQNQGDLSALARSFRLVPTADQVLGRAEAPGTLLLRPSALPGHHFPIVQPPRATNFLPSPLPLPNFAPTTHSGAEENVVAVKTQKNDRNSENSKNEPKAIGEPLSMPSLRTSLTSGARTEHLLLAARKIGRMRAGMVAGIIDAEWETKTRRKTGSGRTVAGDRRGKTTATKRSSDTVPVSANTRSARKIQLNDGVNSLLTAARSMMDSGSEASATLGEGLRKVERGMSTSARARRPASAIGHDARLPTAKRYKRDLVDDWIPERVRSALDVLADEAVAVTTSIMGSSTVNPIERDLEEDVNGEDKYKEESKEGKEMLLIPMVL
ncbi:hypothetical protein BT96DRAFT_1011826 [Gymnopus androsaceus JB14]|uniref:Uncharacterized protein n=1 Tax=Gymnopus androsaceus JB14 TaxID=1447944 RepID=A0A6A4IIC2_9AGAR|nr:hypothetical protein BT96DRAFT_1011826 [Gymnopus androsaceus JB14]